MRKTSSLVTLLLASTAATVMGVVACGDDADIGTIPTPDAEAPKPDGAVDSGDSPDSSKDSGQDSGKDAAVPDPIKHLVLKHEDLIVGEAPVGPSSYGFASKDDSFGGTGTSWRYRKPSTGSTSEKFEFYVPLAAADSAGKAAALGEITAYLGNVTLADLKSVKLRTRRNDAKTADFTMIVYTVPHAAAAENDASWYARRLHVPLAAAKALNAPASTWNEYSTATGTNELRFWDYRNEDVSAGVQPNNNYFGLADIQAGPVTPTGVTGARDYRTEQIRWLSFSTNSSDTAFDGSIDGIEIVLKSGKGVTLDLDGDSNLRRISLSHARLLDKTPPDTNSSYGDVSKASPFGGAGVSWIYVKDAASPTNEKFELHLPFAAEAANTPDAIWDDARAHLGDFTIADLKSISVQSRIAVANKDFTMLVYTVPDGTDDDKSWYGRRLHAQLDWAASRNAPVDTWNAYSTNAGANQIRFWDMRTTNVQPTTDFFTLAQLQAGAVTPTGQTPRDYRTEKVKFITLSTYSNETAFSGSLDGVEIRLNNGRALFVDFDR